MNINKPRPLPVSEQRKRPRRFYPGGDIVDYFNPVKGDGLNIQWEKVINKETLISLLRGMIVSSQLTNATEILINTVAQIS